MKQMKKNDDIAVYIQDQEYIANNYVMKCFTVTMLVYAVAFFLNMLGIFVIEQKLMWKAFIPSVIIYILVYVTTKFWPLSSRKEKYFILFNIMLVFTITGVYITYHVVLISLLPILYATLYSSKKVLYFVYILTVFSTIIIVYGGYFYGLCDANMVLLTTNRVQDYISEGQFILTMINKNPYLNLALFYVLPRCLIYIAVVFVCESIFNIVSGSLEKAKLTSELEKAKTTAENANQAKTQFLAKISHEIRSPINAILAMNEMILRESEEDEIKNYACDVKKSSLMLLNIVNEILDSSKIESGMMEIVPGNYEIANLLEDLYHMIHIKAKEKGLEFIFEADPSIPAAYFGDDKRIKQILLNLLTNAVKYTKQGFVTLKVNCEVQGEEAFMRFAVKDTGIGIREENIEKINHAFQRFDMEKNRDIEGTGLGVTIAQQLLRLMGSELKIESEYGKGSEFSFEIRQRIVDTEPLGEFPKRTIREAKQSSYRTNFVAPQARILVVDDNKMNLKVFKSLLKETQMQIFEAESGKQCLDLIKQEHYDVIFLDHMMPEMDGVETLHVIRDNNLCDDTPIIMLTANAVVGNRERFIAEGFDDFLSKPILPDKLDKMILQYLPERFVTVFDSEAEHSKNMFAEQPILLELRKRLPEIDFETGILSASLDADFYLELLRDFVELPIKAELTSYLEVLDKKNYCIRIHGFKNSAYFIGAKNLGDLAHGMEYCAEEMFPGEIPELQEKLLQQYDRICDTFNKVMNNYK